MISLERGSFQNSYFKILYHFITNYNLINIIFSNIF